MEPTALTHLEAVIARLNRMTGSPLTPYTEGKANPGNYHLDGAYGGHRLMRMASSGTGCTDVLHCGYVTKRELCDRLEAFIAGLEARS